MAFSQTLSYLVVALGGGVGAVLRFWVGQNVPFPYGTFTVNVIGSFLIGIGFAISIDPFYDKISLFFMAGLLGGFTTLSSFSLDVLKLYEDGKIVFMLKTRSLHAPSSCFWPWRIFKKVNACLHHNCS